MGIEQAKQKCNVLAHTACLNPAVPLNSHLVCFTPQYGVPKKCHSSLYCFGMAEKAC